MSIVALGRRRALTLVALLLAMADGCASALPTGSHRRPAPVAIGCLPGSCPASDSLKITFLGVAGFLFEAGRHSLLTGPMYTNPPLTQVGYFPVEPNASLIEDLLPAAANRALMIVVGHGHYDHLMDVPYVAKRRARDARIYAGPSIVNMLAADADLTNRVHAIGGDSVGNLRRCGKWVYDKDSAFRIMAFDADHSPLHRFMFWNLYFANGTVKAKPKRAPRAPLEWKVGEPYTYFIDVLASDKRTPVFRVYYQDTANDAPLGFPPLQMNDRRVDLAILTVANAQSVNPPAPAPLLWFLRPRYVIASHWEDFFRTQKDSVRPGAVSKIPRFQRILEENVARDGDWWMPNPGTEFWFAPHASAARACEA
jgi:hypothetical protein